jgi:hypothetical protein
VCQGWRRGKERKRGTRSWGWAVDILLPTAPDLDTSRGLPLYFAVGPPLLELTFSPLFSLHFLLELTFSPLFSLGRQSHGFQVCIFCAGCVVLGRRIEKNQRVNLEVCCGSMLVYTGACNARRHAQEHAVQEGMHRSMQYEKACNTCNNQRSPQSVGCARPLEELFCDPSLAPSAPGLRFASDTRASSVVRIHLESSKGYQQGDSNTARATIQNLNLPTSIFFEDSTPLGLAWASG